MRQSLLPVFIAMLFAAGLLASTNPTTNAYKFGGKEMETRYALNFTHHGARLYFPDLGRFASPDPLAGKTPQTATYLYCGANPVNFIDPTGLKWGSIIKGTTYEYELDYLSNVYSTILESNTLSIELRLPSPRR